MNNPQFTQTDVFEVRTVFAAVEGSEQVPLKGSRVERSFRVRSAVVRYQRANGEPWVVDEVRLRGPWVNKDGMDSAHHADQYVLNSDKNTPFYPSWVPALVQQFLPGGDR